MIRSVLRHTLSWLVLCAASAAVAQGYPTRPVALVVPFAAGGPTDTIARILAERMTRSLGQQVVVENVAGAGGVIGNTRVLKATPDGHTIMIGHVGTHVLAPAVQRLTVDYVADFEPISQVVTNPQVVLVRKGVPANNLQELVAWAKANPGKVSFGSGGVGTPSHVMAAQFSTLVAPLNIVHYKGSGPAMQDVVAGHVDMSFDQAATGLAFARSGQARAFAVTAKTRLASAPEIPTVDEAGLPGFYMSIWHAMWAPKGTPREVISRLDTALREALADPAVSKRLGEMGQVVPPAEQLGPAALRAQHRSEVEKWHPVIRTANIQAN